MSPSLSKADHYIAWDLLNLFDLTPTASTNFAKTFTFVHICSFVFLLSVTLQPCTILLSLGEKMEMQVDNFAKHPKKGDETKSYSCNRCNYTCDWPSSLKSHMLVHSGEKAFSCTKCDYSAKHRNHLKSHMLIHSGEKTFKLRTMHLLLLKFF